MNYNKLCPLLTHCHLFRTDFTGPIIFNTNFIYWLIDESWTHYCVSYEITWDIMGQVRRHHFSSELFFSWMVLVFIRNSGVYQSVIYHWITALYFFWEIQTLWTQTWIGVVISSAFYLDWIIINLKFIEFKIHSTNKLLSKLSQI